MRSDKHHFERIVWLIFSTLLVYVLISAAGNPYASIAEAYARLDLKTDEDNKDKDGKNEGENTEGAAEDKLEVTPKEKALLARAVYSEARGESFAGQVSVAAVILNRVEHPDFPGDVAGVIFQPMAFTAVQDRQFWLNPNQQSYAAVEKALAGEDPTDGALDHYNPAKATSQWIFSRPVIVKIGQHVFAR